MVYHLHPDLGMPNFFSNFTFGPLSLMHFNCVALIAAIRRMYTYAPHVNAMYAIRSPSCFTLIFPGDADAIAAPATPMQVAGF